MAYCCILNFIGRLLEEEFPQKKNLPSQKNLKRLSLSFGANELIISALLRELVIIIIISL